MLARASYISLKERISATSFVLMDQQRLRHKSGDVDSPLNSATLTVKLQKGTLTSKVIKLTLRSVT